MGQISTRYEKTFQILSNELPDDESVYMVVNGYDEIIFKYLFIFMRETECAHKSGRGRERRGERENPK